MSTQAPARRLLAIYPTRAVAALAAIEWVGYGARDVAVVEGAKGTTPARPWAVTAAKTSGAAS